MIGYQDTIRYEKTTQNNDTIGVMIINKRDNIRGYNTRHHTTWRYEMTQNVYETRTRYDDMTIAGYHDRTQYKITQDDETSYKDYK